VSPLKLKLNGNPQKPGVVEHKLRGLFEDKRIKTDVLGLKIQNNNTGSKVNSFKRMSTIASPTRLGSYLGNKNSKRKLSQK
jgi:hypothetical protein